jgi:hypothetical protein
MDIIAKMGGYKGAFEPFINFFFPLAMLSFLVHYSQTIAIVYKDQHKQELELLVKNYY